MSDVLLISIVTPSYNQGHYLRSTLQSVLSQKGASLEYIVIDGGSEDESLSIIKEFTSDPQLVYWCSEKDNGHHDALNKGFAQSSGDVMGWLNSDDLYLPHTISIVRSIFENFPQVEWLTTTQHVHFNTKDEMIFCRYVGGFNRKAFWRGNNLIGNRWFARAVIQQEATFWRRSLWERTGAYIDTTYDLAGDFELWTRFFKEAELYAVDVPLAGIRKHKYQKTAIAHKEYYEIAREAFIKAGGQPYGRLHSFIRRYLWYVFGYRSLRKIPLPISTLFTKIGLFYPVKIIIWDDGHWRLTTDYVL